MRELVLAPEAFDDLRAAYRWYEQRRVGLGAVFEQAVEAAFMRIARNPHCAPEVARPFRRIVLRRFPYDVYYSFDERQVQVMLVFHTAQDPSGVLRRLGQH